MDLGGSYSVVDTLKLEHGTGYFGEYLVTLHSYRLVLYDS